MKAWKTISSSVGISGNHFLTGKENKQVAAGQVTPSPSGTERSNDVYLCLTSSSTGIFPRLGL